MSATFSTLIVVDPSVAGYQTLVQTLSPAAEVLVLDPEQDGVQQISQTLAQRSGIQSLQIISHGSEGKLKLGAIDLSIETLANYTGELLGWRTALSDDADLLIYGCNVAAGPIGQSFVEQLSQLIGTDVAASDDLTGSAELGGDGELEYTTGAIETSSAMVTTALSQQPIVLNEFSTVVGTFNDLRLAIQAANSANLGPNEQYVIRLASTIKLAGSLPVINNNIAFVGNGFTINGDGRRVLQVDGGVVSLTNLTIANGRVQGATGSTAPSGTNGGAARGAGLLINGGSVTLVSTIFENNEAIGGTGGNGTSGPGGVGGFAEGGAIYVNGGSLRISTSTFTGNKATGGMGGLGSNSARNVSGQGKGGAIYVADGAVITEGTPGYINNMASSDAGNATDNDNVFGSINLVLPPEITAITRTGSEETAANTVSYLVTFDQTVTGVDRSDFELAEGSIPDASITEITPSSGSSNTYTVVVNTGTGNGPIALRLVDDDSIKNSGSVPLAGTGLGNGDTLGPNYTVNKTPPFVQAIDGQNNNPSAATTLTYQVTFSDYVRDVFTNDFTLVTTGLSGASITSVTQLNTIIEDDRRFATNFQVVVNTGTGNGTIALKLNDDNSIRNRLGVSLGDNNGGADGSLLGEVFTIDKTPPIVSSINRTEGILNPTNLSNVSYTVTFSQAVKGVDAGDFTLNTPGIQGASIASVIKETESTYIVLVNTGSGDGSIGLNLNDNNSILNLLDVPLGGSGVGDGNFTGQAFSMIKSAPIAASMTLVNPNPTASGTVNYAVTFTQDVTGVDRSDFSLSAVDLFGAEITAVTGGGRTYNVAVNTGSGSGTLGLNLIDNDSILNSINVPLGGAGAGNANAIGPIYSVNKTPPRVTSISRLETNPTNAGSVNFAVIFNEAVNRVDASDFQLTTQGISGASITSITRVNGSFYTVAISTGTGDGTIGLNLIDNDSILNGVGVILGGAGAVNGDFVGEVYNVDKSGPVVDIIDVTPDARRDKVDAITIQFNEAVRGLDLNDLNLTRSGQSVSLAGATLTTNDGITWTLDNIKKLTNRKGDYELSLSAGDTGITDLAGNPLGVSVSDRWTNLETVEVFEPGITRRGTPKADTLRGTPGWDTLKGLDGNDTLIGFELRDQLSGDRGDDKLYGEDGSDILVGGSDDDLLVGGLGADSLDGGSGADLYVYSGANQTAALANSILDEIDRITGFKASQNDKIRLDFDSNTRTANRPSGLFNAGQVKGRNLESAAEAAYADKNQRSDGRQVLEDNEAVFFKWQGRTYLSVNNSNATFSVTGDLLIQMSGIGFRPGDTNAGVLNPNHYFA